jgi:hypothetical protein
MNNYSWVFSIQVNEITFDYLLELFCRILVDIEKSLVISASHVKIKIMDVKSNKNFPEEPRRESFQRHRRQRFWQIWVPLIIVFLVALTAAVVLVLTQTGRNKGTNLSQYSDTALIWIFVPLLLIALLFAVVMFGLVALNGKILRGLPRLTHPAQRIFSQVSDKVGNLSRMMVRPIISIKSIRAGVTRAFSVMLGRSKK